MINFYLRCPHSPDYEETSRDQGYRLQHIKEIDQFLNDEIIERQRLYNLALRGGFGVHRPQPNRHKRHRRQQ